MAFTKVVGPGIHSASNVHTHNINSAGIITATKFVGPFDNINVGGATTLTVDGINISAGILTAQTLDLNGNGDISGNLVVGGNLTANGDLTTLNTTLREVELLRVDANSSLAAGIITQRGAGDALAVDFDYGSNVIERAFTIHKDSTYGELVGIGTDNPGTSLHIQDVYTTPYPYNAPVAGFLGAVKYPQELVLENAVAGVNGSWTGIMFRSGANSSGSAHGNARVSAVQTADNQADLTFSTKSGTFGERLRITGAGLVGIGTTVPTTTLDVRGNLSVTSGVVVSGGTVTIPTVAGTNTNAALNVLFQTASSLMDGGSQLTYNPGGDVLSVNGNHISANTFRGDGNQGTLTCDNHSSSTFVTVSNTVDISTVDNATDAFTVKQGSNEYITVDTTNTSELITLGNTTTKPNVSILAGQFSVETKDASGAVLIDNNGNLKISNNTARIRMGSSNQLELYHTGTYGYLNDTSSSGTELRIAGRVVRVMDNDSSHTIAYFAQANAKFYADNVERLKTTDTGIEVIGEVAASQDYPTINPLLNFNFRRNKRLEPRMVYRRNGTASFINEFGKVQFVGDNEPRFEHDPNTRECLGLLIEPGGTNLINCSGSAYGSDSISGGNLGPTMQINTVEQVERPDGTVGNVRRLKAHSSGSGMRWGSTSGGNTNQPYAGQMWARTVSGTASVTIDVNDVGQQTYSLTTEWVKMESVGSSSNAYRFLDIFLDGNNDIYVTFIQFENLNYYPRTSSYIPVMAGSNGATRGADLVYLADGVSGASDYTQTIGNDSGKDLTNVFNPVEGTTVVEYFNDTSTNGQYALTWDDGSGNNRMGLVNGNSYQAANNSGGSSQGSIDNGTPKTNDYNKFAFAYKYNNSALCINGNTPTEDTTFTVPTGIKYLWLGCRMGAYDFLGGTITNLKYYPKRLPSSQLKTLTTF